MRVTLALAALLALAACGTPAPRSTLQPVRQPAPPSTAPTPVPLGSDWRDWPLTPGTWTYARDDRGSVALFGAVGADALLTLRCDRGARQIYLSRAGTQPGALTVRTSSSTRAMAARPTGGALPYIAVALAPADPLLDAMGFSRGRFIVEQAGAPTLVVPAWPEIERVAEDCRG